MAEFHGAKLCVLRDGDLLTIQRDDRPDIPFPGFWDLPGGGREGRETPAECVLRELTEELSITLPEDRIVWQRAYPPGAALGAETWFLVADGHDVSDVDIQLGDEGQRWCWEGVDDNLENPSAVPHLKLRLQEFLDEAQALPGA